jgi:predicted transcriptional regulator
MTISKHADKKPAKLCYTHIGGKLGILLLEKFIDKGWLAKDKPTDKHFYITDKGKKEFTKLGIDISQIKTEEL